jgi:hypothetical protein
MQLPLSALSLVRKIAGIWSVTSIASSQNDGSESLQVPALLMRSPSGPPAWRLTKTRAIRLRFGETMGGNTWGNSLAQAINQFQRIPKVALNPTATLR